MPVIGSATSLRYTALTGCPNTCRTPSLPTPAHAPGRPALIVGPKFGFMSSAPWVPMSEVATPMCRLGKPPGIELSTSMNCGKLLARLPCLSAIAGESSTRNSRSRSRLAVTGNATTSRGGGGGGGGGGGASGICLGGARGGGGGGGGGGVFSVFFLCGELVQPATAPTSTSFTRDATT